MNLFKFLHGRKREIALVLQLKREKEPCELSWSNCVAKGKRGKNIFNFNKKFTKVKDFLICVKVPKRHTFWDGESTY